MAMKGYSTFPKAPALPETHYQIVCCLIQDTRWGVSYLSAEMQLMYSAAPHPVITMNKSNWNFFENYLGFDRILDNHKLFVLRIVGLFV